MTVNPCEVGLICPFEHDDGEGMSYCSFPDSKPKYRRKYPYICNLDDLGCPLHPMSGTPLGTFLSEFERNVVEPHHIYYLIEVRGQDDDR